MAITSQDVIDAGKTSIEFVMHVSDVLNEHVDPETADEIIKQIKTEM
ncbi:hypothetical protein SYNTR_0768 [Candidatus Syntrophocurvum alkaliphilum]|uniref:Uncharacterized protein n=1 Tax=Candidatus Syntrophocurvum alkaliphilum TaxID=2293317 RepID=A0A6I6DIL5_9FIRM|nr:hypothetical protein [Candidatus Syntrophocurvum alkaliphilum]QGT99361.1 hypothetical protein SYNTR_0768 [Candidatus Syntrophocurvum alkaliphilum]